MHIKARQIQGFLNIDNLGISSSASIENLDEVLLEMNRRHHDRIPSWEWFEGVMILQLCMTESVSEDEWMPLAFNTKVAGLFANPAQRTRFLMNWYARQSQLRDELENALTQDQSQQLPFQPAVTDWRGLGIGMAKTNKAFASLNKKTQMQTTPSFGKNWARGFLNCLHYWSTIWLQPEDERIYQTQYEIINTLTILAENDNEKLVYNLYDEKGPPTTSLLRVQAFLDSLNKISILYHYVHHPETKKL
jgi:uncharacterized protein